MKSLTRKESGQLENLDSLIEQYQQQISRLKPFSGPPASSKAAGAIAESRAAVYGTLTVQVVLAGGAFGLSGCRVAVTAPSPEGTRLYSFTETDRNGRTSSVALPATPGGQSEQRAGSYRVRVFHPLCFPSEDIPAELVENESRLTRVVLLPKPPGEAWGLSSVTPSPQEALCHAPSGGQENFVSQRQGSQGDEIRFLQMKLNRIAQNYPGLPKINPVDGIFAKATADAVKAFQNIFALPVTGAADRDTLNLLDTIYGRAKQLARLEQEAWRLKDLSQQLPPQYSPELEKLEGEDGFTSLLQHKLRIAAAFCADVPWIPLTGLADERTTEAISAFQRAFHLPQGSLDQPTWQALYDFSACCMDMTNPACLEPSALYPGYVLTQGDDGVFVTALQRALNNIAMAFSGVPVVPAEETGTYGEHTRKAVEAFQALLGLTVNGDTGEPVWQEVFSMEYDLRSAPSRRPVQYPGAPLCPGTRDDPTAQSFSSESALPACGRRPIAAPDGPVREMQAALRRIARNVPEMPLLVPDGIFGPETTGAVAVFQSRFGLPPTGQADLATWNAVFSQADTADHPTLQNREIDFLPFPSFPLDSPERANGGDPVFFVQIMLHALSRRFQNIAPVAVTGIFGMQTSAAVGEFQRLSGIKPKGTIDLAVWQALVSAYEAFCCPSLRPPRPL